MNQSLYSEISRVVPGLHGWCELPKALTLANYVLALRPAVVVELGIWGGRSLLPMAMAVKAINCGKVIGIDPWLPQASIEGQDSVADQKWWGPGGEGGLMHEAVMGHFMAQIELLELRHCVDIMRSRSDDIQPPKNIGLLHIDGNHGPQAYRDAERYAPNVEPGGMCILDDLHWTGGNVEKAAELLKRIGFIELHTLGTGAAYLRTK